MKQDIQTIRHSLSHILAYAVRQQFQNAKLGFGPAIENGFYYDFELPKNIGPQDLPQLEKRMHELLKQNFSFIKKTITRAEALQLFQGQPYKLEIIKELKDSEITTYESGKFIDLCAGPHIVSTNEIPTEAFKLTKVAGAYWRGSEKNPMLQRIYGVAFETKKELDEYLKMLEEAEKRDHRILGEKLDLFMVDEKIGKGLPLWLPNGYFVRKILEDYMYKIEKDAGYLHVLTPILAKEELYKTSGHLEHYKEDMYAPIVIENERYYLKPMNCPHHHAIFSHRQKSYKDLPLRIAEFGNVYRYEKSGVLNGLIRVRGFTQNDSHIYATQETLEKEIIDILKMFKKTYSDFKISDYWFRLSLPDFNNKEKYGNIENKKIWEEGASALRNVLKKSKLTFKEAMGEASFYGPKIDIQTKDIYGKEDTIATIQVDYYSAPKFNLTYIAKDGTKKFPVIIHRAILGSFDRFFAFLIERTAGDLPVWLSPIQVEVINVGDKHVKYAKSIYKELIDNEIRAKFSEENQTVGKRIREAELKKFPYVLVVGDKELKAKNVCVRTRGKKKLENMKLSKFIQKVKIEVDKKK